ncbi:MAG: hypothetical protein H7241_10730, partial [Novosphingobium sp.]|nr:hypothetical protein [Novosphingobium sp.]
MKLQFHTSVALATIIAFASATPAFAQAAAQTAPDAAADPADEEPAAIVVTA